MMKKLLLLFSICACGILLHGQNTLLFTEDFQTGGGTFTLNSGGPGSNTGTNNWIINNTYAGTPLYPDTYPEDSTFGGTISFAPYSQYLHIHDAPSGINNTNYNPSNTSDQFAYMTTGVCTRGMDSVHFSFFYLCQGSPTAYGEVYYSVNNGPWVQTGLSQYSNKYKWKYEDITDPAFANKDDVRFGFRWINNSGPSPDSVAFAIDDISIVGTFNSFNASIVVDSVSPNPVCQGSYLYIYWHLTDTLCDGTYAIDLSGPTGIFNTTNTWVANINNPQMSGLFVIILPTSSGPGNCYKVRIRRTSPAPTFTGTASACFSIIACPNVITTLQPVVTYDTNAVCIGSVIDVPFYSTGVYNANNVYTAQLSDSNGVFSSTPPIVGTFANSGTYDPSLGSPPGTVAGLVPNVPPGCGYYIRVVSSNPATTGAPWGPFCIGNCDIITNNMQDLHFCVTDCSVDPSGSDTTIDINVNNAAATYGPGNVFTTQLMSSMTFAQIGSNGILGSVAATGDTTLDIHVPCKDSLSVVGIPVGMNYLRVVATNSSIPDNSLGSLIRFTVGAPHANAETITSYDFNTFTPRDTFCAGDIVALFFSPYNYFDNSTYMWKCNGINGGNPFVSPSGANSNSLYVSLGGPGILTFQVQETSYGCVGPWSPVHTIVVLGTPNVIITGPHFVCQGDTNTWGSTFMNGTYYTWGSNGGNIVDTANNQIQMSFPNTGTYQITLHAINQCGSANSLPYNITVNPYPVANAGPDTVLCGGGPVTLSTPTGTGYQYTWSNGTSNIGTTSSITVTPTTTTSFIVTTTVTGGCQSKDTVLVTVDNLADSISSTPSSCLNFNGTATANTTGGAPPITYNWSNGPTTPSDTGLAPGSYTCTVTDANGCSISSSVNVGSVSQLNPDAGTFVTITAGQSTVLNGTGGGNYSWSPSTGLSCPTCANTMATPTVTTTYTLTVSDSLGCIASDTVTVFVQIDCGAEFFIPNAFSPNGDNQNDVLYLRGVSCIQTLDFSIYNRWGERVFHTTDPMVGWDGMWRGVPCEDAVFTYVVNATMLDGSKRSMHGNVSIIK